MNNITGTLINYFFHCQTQCCLHANRINNEDNSLVKDNLDNLGDNEDNDDQQ